LQRFNVQPGFFMTTLHPEALVAVAASLAVLMAGAGVVQQRTSNSGWVDTIWTFSPGLVGAGSALWPVKGALPNARQWGGDSPPPQA
jgi:steroid 5-alpha reductase family enzyme